MEGDDVVTPGGAATAEDAERAYVAGLIARGEAARPDAQGNLPAGATHALVEDETGRTIAQRHRFS